MLSLYCKILTECGNNSQNNVLSIVTGLCSSKYDDNTIIISSQYRAKTNQHNCMQMRCSDGVLFADNVTIHQSMSRLCFYFCTIWGIKVSVVTSKMMWWIGSRRESAPSVSTSRHTPHRKRRYKRKVVKMARVGRKISSVSIAFCLANWYSPPALFSLSRLHLVVQSVSL